MLAPLLEEVVFRGFLLATLTKWVPVPAALLLSSLAFGAAHMNVRDFPEVTHRVGPPCHLCLVVYIFSAQGLACPERARRGFAG